ncbi:Thioredoxin [Methanocaldococcus lauensis]|nr:Thioredoxin [Methanocaldococcus lauensis]
MKKYILSILTFISIGILFCGCININENVENKKFDFNETCIVEFTAEWCGYCKKLEPTIEELEKEGYKVIKIDIDKNRDIAEKYGIRAMPTIFYVKDGKIIDVTVGYNPEEIKEKAKQLKG